MQGRALMAYTRGCERLFGDRLPRPEYMPDVKGIVTYLAEAVRQRHVRRDRLRRRASRSGSAWRRRRWAPTSRGTAFFGGGEPYTEGKAAVLSGLGARGSTNYAMQEAG